jgi:hypothetical protein
LKQRGYDGEKDESEGSQPLWRSGSKGGGAKGRDSGRNTSIESLIEKKQILLHMISKFKNSKRRHHQISTVYSDYRRVRSLTITRRKNFLKKMIH